MPLLIDIEEALMQKLSFFINANVKTLLKYARFLNASVTIHFFIKLIN